MPSSAERPIPPIENLLDLLRASLFNARDLLDDARALLSQGRIARAHALATLALEEIGKSHICMLALVPAMSPFSTAGEFWKAMRRHEDKLMWARGVLALLIQEPDGPIHAAFERLMDESRLAHLTKMRGLYVDFQDDHILIPSQIERDGAEQLVNDVQVALDFSLASWGDDQAPERAKEALTHQDELAELSTAVHAALERDADQALNVARVLIRASRDDSDK